MAKKKIETTLAGWDQVNEALRRMAEIDIALGEIEGRLTLEINDAKAGAEAEAGPHKEARRSLEADITAFCEEHKEEFAKVRSKEFTFGLIGYRVVAKLVIKSKKACLAAMRALGLDSYIRVIEEPDKDAMDGLDDATLARIGASRKTEDKLRIEPNLEKLKEVA